MAFLLRVALLCLVSALSGGCAHKPGAILKTTADPTTLVALVPDPNGAVGHITVTNEGGSVAISTPFEATTVSGFGRRPDAPKHVGREELREMFADALSIQPEQPPHFMLYFVRHNTFTPGGLNALPAILSAIRQRNSVDITVIGHADTMGTDAYNVDVSFDRAILVKELLVQQGIDPTTIWTDAEGEKNLPVPTADEVWELKNRCVEVVVR